MKSFWKHLFLDNGDLTLIEAGLQKYIPQQMNNYKVRHDFVLHVIVEGAGVYTVNNKTYELTAQDGFILRKNQQVFYTPNLDQPWIIAWIGLGGKNLHQYLQQTTLISQDVYTFAENSAAREELITFIRLLANIDPANQLDYLHTFSRLYQLLLSLNHEFPLHQHRNNSYTIPEASLAENVYEFIYENFLKNLSITQIADHFNISRNYLFKICKEYYGQSPKNMIQELRMNQAVQLLRGSKMQIKEIANIVGYKDAFSFSKMFSQYYNYSPSEFRQLKDDLYDEILVNTDNKLRKKLQTTYY